MDRQAIAQRLSTILAESTVEVSFASPAVSDFRPAAVEALSNAGFHTVNEKGLLRLPLNLDLRRTDIDGQVRLDGRLFGTIEISPAHGAATLGALSLNERASAPTIDSARDRLQRKLAAALAKDLDARLLKLLAGG